MVSGGIARFFSREIVRRTQEFPDMNSENEEAETAAVFFFKVCWVHIVLVDGVGFGNSDGR